MVDVTLMLPSRLDGRGLCRVMAQFLDMCGSDMPDIVTLDFAKLGFVEPAGVTFLSNIVFWLDRQGVTVRFTNELRQSDAIRFLDDSLFFEQHIGARLNSTSRPRATTKPLQWVEHDQSHNWLRSELVPWLSGQTGVNAAGLYRLQVCLSELFNNIQDHTSLNVGSIFIQHFPNKKQISISIADFGRGIPDAVQTVVPDLSDNEAIIQAVQEGFTTRSTPRNSGIGLDYLLRTVVLDNGGMVRIFSLGGHVLFTRRRQEVFASPLPSDGFCPGTTVDIRLDTTSLVSIEDEEEDLAW